VSCPAILTKTAVLIEPILSLTMEAMQVDSATLRKSVRPIWCVLKTTLEVRSLRLRLHVRRSMWALVAGGFFF
jgi:hypothetical protein